MSQELTGFLRSNRQLILYCIIGGCCIALDFAIFSILAVWVGVDYQLANFAGYSSGTATSFILNARLNFKTSDRIVLRFLSFCAVGGLGLLTSASILWIGVDRLELNKCLAKTVTLPLIFLLQYNLNRLLSSRRLKRCLADQGSA